MAVDLADPEPSVTRWHRQLIPGDWMLDDIRERTARDWAVDWLLFALGCGFGVIAVFEDDRRLWLLNSVVGVAACTSLFWRRSHPFGFGLFAAFASCVSSASGLVFLVAMFNSALRLERRQLIPILALTAVGFITSPLLYGAEESPVAMGVLAVGVVALLLGLGFVSRARREHFLALATVARAVEAEQRLREQRAREAERHRIARDMHDVVGHRLALLSLHSGALEYRSEVSPAEARETAGVIRSLAASALQELRDVVGVLRTEVDEQAGPPQPGLGDIPALVDEFRAAGVKADLEIDDAADLGLVSPLAGRAIFRVVREGLVNAAKHAPGARVQVRVECTPGDRVRTEVANDLLVGAVPEFGGLSGKGAGLIGLQEHLALVGGSSEHSIEGGRRFRLIAEVPAQNE